MQESIDIEVDRIDVLTRKLRAAAIINGVQSNWLWSDAVAGDPGSGNMRGNQNTMAAVTELGVSSITALGLDMREVLSDVPPTPADFIVVFNIERSVTALYTIDPPGSVDNDTWRSYPVTYAGGNSANPANGDAMGARFKWTV